MSETPEETTPGLVVRPDDVVVIHPNEYDDRLFVHGRDIAVVHPTETGATSETATCPPCAIANEVAAYITDGLAAAGQRGGATHEGICQGHGCECGCTPADTSAMKALGDARLTGAGYDFLLGALASQVPDAVNEALASLRRYVDERGHAARYFKDA